MGNSPRVLPKASKADGNEVDSNNRECTKDSKRGRAEKVANTSVCRKMPKRAAACSNFKERSISLSEKSSLIESKREVIAENELAALTLTSGQNDSWPNRRLKDFSFHDTDGSPKAVEMLQVNDLYMSGVILPLENNDRSVKETAVRCHLFGRVESWSISGYEEGTPVFWVSTESADYECLKPSSGYKRLYSLFFAKASACIEVYKKLSRTHGGNPNVTLEELVAGVARSMTGSKNFPQRISIKDFLFSQGDFIYTQLVGLDHTSKENDQVFTDLPVLVALRDEKKHDGFVPTEAIASGRMSSRSLKIEETATHSTLSSLAAEDEDMKLARLRQEEENWTSMNQKDRRILHLSRSYIKINEDEIANDYPLPSFYKTSIEETDEFIVIDDGSIDFPENALHNWTLYNSDARLISLELVPMMPCADIDVTVFGSGTVTDGSGFNMDVDSYLSSSDLQVEGGLPIYLSAIKEWKIEFGGSLLCISIRTDMSWYRLGKPSKHYVPWYEPVLKTARLGISIITMLTEQSRVSRLSFLDVIKRVSEFEREHPAFISSNLELVERFVVVHGPIIVQLFAEYPDKNIKRCTFVTGLQRKMEERHHTKLQVNRRRFMVHKGLNLNPREAVATSASSTRKAMQATTTRLINRIWGGYYSNYLPADQQVVDATNVKDDKVEEEQEENAEEDFEEGEDQKLEVDERTMKSQSDEKLAESHCSHKDIRWKGMALGNSCTGAALYKQAIVYRDSIAVGDFVLLERSNPDQLPSIYFLEYMYENSDARKMAHGRLVLQGFQTVLGNAANEREVFLTNDCGDFELDDVKHTIVVEIRSVPWGYQHRRANVQKDKIDRERAADRKSKGLPIEYYCKSLYWPQRGAFFSLPKDTLGLGSGLCHCCITKEMQREKEGFTLNLPCSGFTFKGTDYFIHDFVYIAPNQFATNTKENGTFKSGRNVGLRPFAIGQLLDIEVGKPSKEVCPELFMVKVRIFFRPEDISTEKAYCSDVREVYYSEQISTIPIMAIEGRCEVRKKYDLPSLDSPSIVDHAFFCEHMYDPDKGTVKQLPANIKFSSSKSRLVDDATYRKEKRKYKEEENESVGLGKKSEALCKNWLATLDIFAGCGGLSKGLEQAGASLTKWAIEYEEPAGKAFELNHPEALVFVNNCNVILRAIMSACGDLDDCISTSEASELAEKLDEKEINSLPRPGQVEFINGGPPCQGFSGMNRFNQGTWSKVQCEMILAFLSFADYFRPKFFLLENVRNFVSFNKGQTFRLTLASLLEIGYQVRFGILEAGAFGVSQSRKRAFIWAASPEETLPEWPEPMHVFAGPELKVTLSRNAQFAAVRSTAKGAPFRAITVRDTIGDLPAVGNGASVTTMDYKTEPVSWFQKIIRRDAAFLSDHISKEMNELNLIRCKRIPKRPGADWRDLSDEQIRLSNGQLVNLIPWCLPNTADRHSQWKGLFGRLDWEGNFPTSITDPQPMGKVGMCFHPEQDRIITVRECARSQGFPDSYKFTGTILQKHRQIGNAVPPPLAFALGRKLKEAVEAKASSS